MSMMRYTYDYNGMRYTIDAPAGATAEDLQALIGGGPQQAAQPPAQPTPPEEEESYLSTLGRAARRGISSFESGLAEIAETAPEIIGTLAGNLIPGAPVASKLLGGIGQQISKTEPYRELTHPTAQGLRQSAQERLAEIGPRQYRGVFEEEGLGRKLASLGETVAESAIPVGAGVATGLVTRSPVAAGIVMGAGNVPMTYGGIRERQKAEGIDDVQRAVVGTIASSALDIMTGVGGKVLSGTAAVAAREILESGIKQAVVRIAKSGGEEAVTESLQNVVEQVAGGTDPTTKQAMLETLESGLAGALGGTVFTGGSELVTAPFRPKGGAATETNTDIAESPEVQQEYLRLVSEQAAARMQSEPGLTQRQAFDRVLKDSASLYDTAVTNVLGGTTPSGKADVDTGLDVSGGAESSISPAGAAVPAGAVPGEREPSTAGGVGEPTTSVSAVTPSTAAGEPALDLGEFAPTVATLQEAPSNKARKPIAMQLVSDVVQANPDLQGLPKNKYSQAANQMVLAAARGEQFDPVAIVQGVAPKPKAAPEVAAPEVAAPEVATPKVKRAIWAGPEYDTPVTVEDVPPQEGPDGRMYQQVRNDDGTPSYVPVDELRMAAPEVVTPEVVTPEVVTPEVATPPQFKVNPELGEGYDAWVDRVYAPENRGPDNQTVLPDVFYRGVSDSEFEAAQQKGEFTPLVGDELYVSDNPERYIAGGAYGAKGAGYIVQFDTSGITPKKTAARTMGGFAEDAFDAIPTERATRIWKWDPQSQTHVLVAERPTPTTLAPETAPPGAPPAPPPPPTGGTPPSGPGPKKQPKVVSNGKPVTLTEAQTRAAVDKAEATRRKLNRIQKRIANTNRTADVLSGQIEFGKLARGDTENWALLRGVVDTLDVGKWKLILPTLSTEDIFRILKGRIEGLTEADRLIRQDITRFETKEYLALADELEQIADFLKKHPKAAQALSDLQFASVAYQVDPSKAANAEEYADKFDKKTRELQAELNNTAVTDAKKQRSLKTKIDNRLREIRSVYEGALLDDGRVFGWRDLARPELGANKGKEIFKLIRDAHRRDLEASYNAIKSRLEETKEGEKLDEALEKLEKQFKPAREQTIYFPAMRFGQFYARVGTGANSIFKMFETETKRNQFMRLMKARGEEITQFGNVDDLRSQFESVTGSPLKDVLDLFEDNPRDIAALRSQVFDLWLQTMSDGDMRKHMAPRMMRAGYSTDILKNFANFRRSSINSAKRAQFGYKLRNEISRAKDSIEGQPDRAKMQEFIKEVELRTMSDLTPPERGNSMWQQALRFGNKVAFYQYLANPKTAIIQLTQMHIVALPMLAQKYGTAKATASLGKYGFSSLGGFVASPLKAIKREDGSFVFDWEQPNLLDNPISSLKKESDPELYEVLSEGWQEGRDINLYMDTFANDIGGYGMADPKQRNALQELAAGRVLPATLRGATFVFESMGTLMHQMERVNREAVYMAALELGYRENRKKGQTHEAAKKAAIEEATATTLAATFDFSAYNKPRVLTTPLGKVAGQFFTYPYMMTSLLMRKMYTAIKGLEPGERSAAIKVATGTFANIALYSGFTGLPLYGVFKVMDYLLSSLFGEDDDTDWDWWFRNEWIPQFFGPDGTVANLLGLDDAQAELLARSVEKGPISALTDVDLSNSVALDFMFFLPEAPRAETPEGQVMETVFNMVTGAAGGALMDYVKAGRDIATGYSERALEKMPKVISNIAKANRFGTEGQLNYAGELAGMDKEFWTSDKQILLTLGFNSTEAAQRQQQNYEGRAITKKVEKARETALSLYRKVAIDVEKAGGMTGELRPDYDAAIEAVNKFNAAHPEQLISPNTLFETQVNAVLKMRESQFYEGVPVEKRGKTPHLEDILRRRVNQAEE